MEFDYKIILGIIASIMTIWAHIPYFLETIKGTNKPHVFTWIIWTLLTFIAFAAQFKGNAGAGAWVTGVTGVVCILITVASFRRGEKNITRGDWITFIAGLSAIPVWMMTSNPLLAVIIVTAIDVSAVIPTFRKAWVKPYEENSFMYGFNLPRHICSMAAIQSLSLVTVLYPAALFFMNLVMYVMLKVRRTKIV